MESITNVLSSIFKEEVMEPQREFEGKLETMLSETWRHLRETDVRQPYIVNWNNSLGQKTLLRALCIDSRNIPQKPLTPSSSSQGETASLEKASTKPGGWTQTKSDKIYSSTLNVQPLRQINLPDTHIFTPTDSETPRSKTIHYNNVPPILSQPVLDNTKPVESFPAQNTEPSNEKDDDDDWEFQDFRGSSGGIKTATAPQTEPPLDPKLENISKPNVTYQTQVLQPIRMEPLMPSLNWPDPGEVKETFEDFSDFVSKTSWNNEQSHITPQESRAIAESGTLEIINDGLKGIEVEAKEVPKLVPQAKSSESFDDDFDTFQSALPPKNSTSDFAFNSTSSNTFNNIPSQSIIKDFDYTFPKNNNKSDTISVENTRPNEALTHSLGFTPTPELTSNKKLLPLGNPMSSNLLQPLPMNSNTTQKHKKTAQILQPLSLESYSQINWPNPGIDLQDLSRFNPVETLQSLKTELSAGSGGGPSKGASPIHAQKNAVSNQAPDDDWGEFVSSKPKQQTLPKKAPGFVDDDEWTDFVSSPSVKPQNGLNTISLNVHTNSNIQKSSNKLPSKNSKAPLDIPTLNYITPKSSGHSTYNERHFQNL
ncbi:Uncharacterized protein OBRU01_24577 [Operophtera brumata]|uniref:Aftiphilin clathrin-binding box domain-containing protein n=1 Tax=Operophtera brumata TaxID=104452 RepID=A0A0L7KLU1_OPEBR|nr:Uncharacterized protein OBRU01_24577 [Operophtera brumata]